MKGLKLAVLLTVMVLSLGVLAAPALAGHPKESHCTGSDPGHVGGGTFHADTGTCSKSGSSVTTPAGKSQQVTKSTTSVEVYTWDGGHSGYWALDSELSSTGDTCVNNPGKGDRENAC